MNIESNLSGHWTDEQLIQHLYGVGPEGNHIDECSHCQARLSAMHVARSANEIECSPSEQVPLELLAAQRRSIYSRIDRLAGFQLGLQIRRWAAAGAMVVLLGGGFFLYEQNQHQQAGQNKVTDAQLAQEVSQVAQDSEPSPTRPLQGLFDE
ncbi:MAG: hypothetical protein JO051_14885 [Acidobacteriaceae bacterium]|nr:hypothetical protein [Acidobacteriaceae bacterium]